MSARERIESLTNSWYGYTLFTGLLTALSRGFSLFWLFYSAAGVLFSLFITHLLGKWLLARSQLTRTVLLGGSLLFSVVGLVGTVKLTSQLLGSFSLGTLFEVGIAVVWLGMNVPSFRTLPSSDLKSYLA